MKLTPILFTTFALMLSACGSDQEVQTTTGSQPRNQPQGLVSPAQQTALRTAAAVEQTLTDSAEIRRQQLEAQLKDL